MKAIVLTGMPGAGKTSIAQILSTKTGIKYADIDLIIEKSESASITSIFRDKGEVYFRNREKEIIENTSEEENIVISLGGGAFENKDIRELLLKKTYVVYLEASEKVLYERIKHEKNRPLLENNPQKTIKNLLKKREKNYKLAHFTILTDNKTTDQIADEIIKCVNLK